MSLVAKFLQDLELSEHLASFRENDIGDDVLLGLTADDLKELGVASLGHRKRILSALQALREKTETREMPRPALADDSKDQRREVTVLFSDLTGYTKLINRLPVEDMHDILASMYDRFDGIVRRMGGTVDRHIGDCVMAVFGAPVSYGNDVERALRCAIEMHDAMREISRLHGVALSVHIGVAAGRVLYSSKGQGGLAESGFTVTGGTINLASRLADRAEGTETLISEETYAELRGRVDCEAIENVEVQGFANPLKAFRFLGFRAARAEHRFVGRAAELGHADRALNRCLDTKHGQVLFLVGEAGIGKTSLLDQISERASRLSFRTHRVLVLDFGLGGDETVAKTLLSQLTGLSVGATETAVEPVVRRYRQLGTLDEKALYIFERAMGLKPEGAGRLYLESLGDAALTAAQNDMVTRLIEADAHQVPLLIAVEDLHWADAETLDLVGRLAQLTTSCQLVLALTSRHEGGHLADDWQRTNPSVRVSRFALKPLSRAEAQELADVLQAPKNDLILKCLERAEGNPLFLAQLLQHASEVNDEIVPGTIQSLVQSKIDRLSPDDRNVLNAAAVIGQRFRIDAAMAIAGVDVYEARNLIEAGLIRAFGSDLLFSHALIRDGVYQTVLRDEKKRLHEGAADWFGKSDALLHAEHLAKAGNPSAAAAFLRAAATAAGNRSLSTALTLVERGQALSPATDVGVRLNLLAGDILRDLGRGEESIAAFRSAYNETAIPEDAVSAQIGLIGTMRIMDRLDETAPLIAAAVKAAEATGQFAHLSKLHYLQGSICFPKGDFRGCLDAQTKALDYAEKVDDPELKARALSGLGDAFYAQGRMSHAHEVFEKCLDLCGRYDLGAVEAANRFMLGTVKIYMNQTEEALDEALRSAKLARDVGQLRPEIVSCLTAGWVLQSLARPHDARAKIERGLEAARELGAKRFEPFLNETLVRVLLSEGRYKEASTMAESVLDQTRELSAMNFIGPWVLATTSMTKTDPAVAAPFLDEGEALLRAGCVGHNYFRFYVYAMLGCLDRRDVDRVRHYCRGLADYTAPEPTAWSDFYIALGQAGADLIEGLPGAEKRLEALSHDAEKARLLTSKGRIERLLARDERNEPMKSASIQMGEIR